MSVVVKLNHGLGNKLFKLIHGLIFGDQYNRKVIVYNLLSKHEQNEEYKLFDFFPKIKNLITLIDNKEYESYSNKYKSLMDEQICYAKLDSDPVLLDGYMMIRHYLLNEQWRKWILNILTPINLEKNLELDKPSIGIHIRVGDYLNFKDNKMSNLYFPLYTPEYYIDIIKKYPNHTIYFFTDTGKNFINNHIIPKIKNQYKFISNNALEDLTLLSKCDILILSASTFSFWAGYLSSGEIYCPNYFLYIKLRLQNWHIINADTYTTTDYSIYK
jgi:hypothetical protein